MINRMESELTVPIQAIMEKIRKFGDKDITRFLEVYEYKMASWGRNYGAEGDKLQPSLHTRCPSKSNETTEEIP